MLALVLGIIIALPSTIYKPVEPVYRPQRSIKSFFDKQLFVSAENNDVEMSLIVAVDNGIKCRARLCENSNEHSQTSSSLSASI